MDQEIDLKELDDSVMEQTFTIARNVRHLRESTLRKDGKRMTQSNLADRAGLGDTKISDIEKGRCPNMTLRQITRLAMCFGLKPGDLMRDWR